MVAWLTQQLTTRSCVCKLVARLSKIANEYTASLHIIYIYLYCYCCRRQMTNDVKNGVVYRCACVRSYTFPSGIFHITHDYMCVAACVCMINALLPLAYSECVCILPYSICIDSLTLNNFLNPISNIRILTVYYLLAVDDNGCSKFDLHNDMCAMYVCMCSEVEWVDPWDA